MATQTEQTVAEQLAEECDWCPKCNHLLTVAEVISSRYCRHCGCNVAEVWAAQVVAGEREDDLPF